MSEWAVCSLPRLELRTTTLLGPCCQIHPEYSGRSRIFPEEPSDPEFLESGRRSNRLENLLHDPTGRERVSIVHVAATDDSMGAHGNDVANNVLGYAVVPIIEDGGRLGGL